MMRVAVSQVFPKVDNTDDGTHHCEHDEEQENSVGARRWILKQCKLLIDQEGD